MEELRQLWRQGLRYEYLQEKLTWEIHETNNLFVVTLPTDAATNIAATLARHYRWTLRRMTNWDSNDVLQVYLNALAHAYDPHSDYFSAPKVMNFSISMNLPDGETNVRGGSYSGKNRHSFPASTTKLIPG